MLFRQADGMHSVVMILLKSLQSVTTPNCPRHFHTSTGISSLPTALPHFIPLSSLCVSDSLTGLVMPWLGALSSVSTLGFSSFMSQLKYWPHRSLMYSSFISTSPVALLMVLICPMSFPALSLAAAILQTSFCPSLVSMLSSYSPSIGSAFTLATTFFAVDFASLYSFLSLSALVRFQVFSLSFFSLTAFSVSSFNHQLSSPGVFFPDYLPQISSPHVLICLAVSSHHSSTFVVITSIQLDSMSTIHLLKFSFTFSSFSFHHLICFLPSGLLCCLYLQFCHQYAVLGGDCLLG